MANEVNPSEMFKAYPPVLKAKDIADAMQVCENTAYEMMRQSGLLVHCGRSGKSKRVPRDGFFEWVFKPIQNQTG